MLSQADKPRQTTCHAGCGRPVAYKFSPRVFCSDECRADAKRTSARRAAETQRRKRGVAPVKGTTAACERCEVIYTRMGVRARYCDPCKVEAPKDKARQTSRKRSRERGALPIGATVACAHCAAGFVRTGSRSKYCEGCRAKQERGDLPHLKEAQQRYRAEVWPQKYWNEAGVRERALDSYRKTRQKRKLSPAFTLNERMSAGLRHSLGATKNGARWEALAGYTVTDLMVHLERQFLPQMTWANRGQWHIDHIVPVSSFEFTTPDCPGFKAAWALTNLRPLWATDNVRKSAKRTHLI